MVVSYLVFRFLAAVLRPVARAPRAKLACFCALGPYLPSVAASILAFGIGLPAGTPSDSCRPPALNSIGFLPGDAIFVVFALGLLLLPAMVASVIAEGGAGCYVQMPRVKCPMSHTSRMASTPPIRKCSAVQCQTTPAWPGRKPSRRQIWALSVFSGCPDASAISSGTRKARGKATTNQISQYQDQPFH